VILVLCADGVVCSLCSVLIVWCAHYVCLEQVFLVAGGYNTNQFSSLESSTEVLTTNSPAWSLAAYLPNAMWALRGVTVANILYMTAGNTGSTGSDRDEILAWLDNEQKWEESGKMKMPRSMHAVTTIHLDDPAMEFCV